MPENTAPHRRRGRIRRACGSAFRGFYWLLALSAFYFLLVLELGWLSTNRGYQEAADGIPLWAWSNGIHVDFVVPRSTEIIDWGEFAPLPSGPPAASYRHVIIGWGDHDFYIETRTSKDFSLATTLKAIFLPTRAVMHMSYYWTAPTASDTCIKLHLRPDEYRRFVEFVKASFDRDDSGGMRMIRGAEYGIDDVFYHGVGSYHLFKTCNNWANQALRRAGVRTAVWSPFAQAILDQLERR